MGNNENNGGTPENDILKSVEVVSSSESLEISDVMKEVTAAEDATTVLTGGSEMATTLLTEGMSGTLKDSGKAPSGDGFQSVGSGPLTSQQRPPQPQMPQGGPMPQQGGPIPQMPRQGMPQGGAMPQMPQGGAMPQMPQQGGPVPQQGMPQGGPMPQQGGAMPQPGQSGPIPQQGGVMPQPGQSGAMSQSGPLPQGANPLAQPGVYVQRQAQSVVPNGQPMGPMDVNGRPVRPPKDPAKTAKAAKIFGLVTGIIALLGLIAVVLMFVFFVILPKGDYKGAAEKGYVAGSSSGVQPGGSTETPATEQKSTEEE